ncbi:MAG TPA: LLM class flavin-dependent oxidoreductase [Methylomirabilota bacterium]|jgi:alkanesulfonate monooxygenase SsuD/methylene tetrahydromethanopterin reductase-like flavin-dependent oxidoreductase (luciferase family)|nr:LLM class flavin-dependent oxidoreductase [Methylomirabilota bacterium]
MKIGIQNVFPAHKDYSDRDMYKHETRLLIEAEGMGFDIIWPVEHHFFDYSMCPDNMQYLSYIAARTERMELGTGAIILPWNNPMRVVEKMVLLDHLSDGRAVLGLGRGLSRREYAGFGVDMSEARERFNEAAAIVLQGLETGVVEANTKYYQQARVEVRPRPFKSFKGRRYMVCMSPESFSVAASLGLGAMMFSQTAWEKMAPQLEAYRAEYRQHNNGEEAPPISIVDFVSCFPDRKKAEEVAHRGIVGYYWTLMEHYRMDDSANFAATGASYQHYAKAAEQINALGHDAVIQEFINANLWGTPDMILKTLRHRREVIGDFEVNGAFSYYSIPYEDVETSMRLFAREVGPEIKSWQPQARRQPQHPIDVRPAAAPVAAK